jgi:nitrite reductase/ring-hydroxylating ferredoxin subunit
MASPPDSPRWVRLVPLEALKASGAAECRFGPDSDPFPVVVFAHGGEIRAFENRCPHFSIPLNYEPGVFWIYDGSTLMCAHHSAMFHLDDGVCFDGPCQGSVLRRLDVEVREGAVWCKDPPFLALDEVHEVDVGERGLPGQAAASPNDVE